MKSLIRCRHNRMDMGQATKALDEFIAEIPASKLTGFSTVGGLIYRNTNFRLDMQGVRIYFHLPHSAF